MLIPRCLLPADTCLTNCSRVSVDATWSVHSSQHDGQDPAHLVHGRTLGGQHRSPMSFGSAGSRRLCTDGIQCVYSLQCRDGNDNVPLSNMVCSQFRSSLPPG